MPSQSPVQALCRRVITRFDRKDPASDDRKKKKKIWLKKKPDTARFETSELCIDRGALEIQLGNDLAKTFAIKKKRLRFEDDDLLRYNTQHSSISLTSSVVPAP
jgi:hypothetical protein